MTEDHHHYKQRLETAVANIQNSDKVREENKELVVDFGNWLALRSISYGRQYRYISSLKQIIEHNDFRREPSYIGTDQESIYHDNQRVSVILPETHAEPDTRMGMSLTFRPERSRYIVRGANHQRNGVTHRQPGTAYQPFENGEAS